MAQRVEVTLICDPCGHDPEEGDDVELRKFGLNGNDYEVDLCIKHWDEIDEVLAPFIENARRVTAGRHNRPQPRTSAKRASDALVREWWRVETQGKNAHKLPSFSFRGRIPGTVKEKYEETH